MNIYFILFMLQTIYFFLVAFNSWMMKGGVDPAYRASDPYEYRKVWFGMRTGLSIITSISVFGTLICVVFMFISYIVILTWLISQLIAVYLNSVLKRNDEHLLPLMRVFHTAIYVVCFVVSIFLWFQLFAQ